MKIIGKSNYDLETVSDILVCEKVNEFYGTAFVKHLNDKEGENSKYIFELKPDDYKLYDYWEIYE